jgi:hypothetical protein
LNDPVTRDLARQLREQTVLAKFGELALRSENLDEILTEACRLVGEGLGTDPAKVMMLEPDGETCWSGPASVGSPASWAR